MAFLVELWLPLLLSAVAVFVASSVIHMAFQYHRDDYRPLPSAGPIMDAMRQANLAPGQYQFPPCTGMKSLQQPEVRAAWERGPVGTLTIRPNGMPDIGRSLGFWFLNCLIVSVFTAYLGGHALEHGSAFWEVFRVTGTIAVLAYTIGSLDHSIWFGRSWCVTARFVFDGTVYGLVTAAVFAGLWPAA